MNAKRQRRFTTAEAAAALDLSRRTVQRLIQSGDLPATRFGRDYEVSLAALEGFRTKPPRKSGWPKGKRR